MPEMQIEFTDNTYVVTEQGVERLVDLLHRPVHPCLWAIKWQSGGKFNGVSFHKSHKAAKSFVSMQLDSKPLGCARLVDVSKPIYDNVQQNGFCWAKLNSFDEALTYEGEIWNR